MTTVQPKKTHSSSSKASTPDAIDMLMADHKKVQKMFKDYDKLIGKSNASERSTLANQICDELRVHAELEETLFYPAMRLDEETDQLIDEATVEHASAKDLIAQLSSMKPNDPLYDAKVTVLGEYISHHVKEEEEEMFPLAQKKKLDLVEIGEAMGKKKAALSAEVAATPS